MAKFEDAIESVLLNEGGYTWNANDAGGETSFGISKRSYPDLNIKTLTRDAAKEIYRRDYWMFDGIDDQPVATKLLDMCVNMGKTRAITLLQRGLCIRWGYKLKVDGKYGAETEKAANEAHLDDIMNELRTQSVLFYASLVSANKSNAPFFLGWVRRGCQ
jgi:lysozyme family protein